MEGGEDEWVEVGWKEGRMSRRRWDGRRGG